ncbi:MAG TPA: hypothetical protein DEO88_15500, partial [Syntrophobacteraceae bacterium]|nr:hypothetical protein [Syntrophobacteraceae bacterium]
QAQNPGMAGGGGAEGPVNPVVNAVDLRGSCHFDRREKSFRPRTIQRFLASLEMTELPARSLSQQH